MSSQTLPEREQLRIIGDLAALNGLPSRSALEGLDPAQFDVGERCLFIELCKVGKHPRNEVLPMMSRVFRGRLSAQDPDAGEYEPPTWADYLREAATARWEWYPWLPSGELSMIGGWLQAGKSYIALRIAAVYVAGQPWPDGTPYEGPKGRVVWCEGEHGQFLNADRARAWGLPLESFLAPVESMTNFNIHNEEHFQHLQDLAGRPDVLLVVIDSLSGIHGGEENSAAMSRIISPLADLATIRNKPVLLSHHPGKPPKGHPETEFELRDFRGSGTILQPCRAAWAIDTPNLVDLESRRLRICKCNLIRPDDYRELGFRIHDTGINFAPEAPQPTRVLTKKADARNRLREILRRGPERVEKVKQLAQHWGCGWRTVERAATEMRIQTRPFTDAGGAKYSLWALPGHEWEPPSHLL